jgi:hypothetical protein
VLCSGSLNHSKSLDVLVFFPLFQLTSKTLRPLLILGFRAGALRHPAGDLLSDSTLLIAISVDANNKLVPLAFALVEKENKDS